MFTSSYKHENSEHKYQARESTEYMLIVSASKAGHNHIT